MVGQRCGVVAAEQWRFTLRKDLADEHQCSV